MLHSSNSLPSERKDAFASVGFAVCIDGQNATQNNVLDYIQASLNRIIANSIAPSTGLMVISDHQLAH